MNKGKANVWVYFHGGLDQCEAALRKKGSSKPCCSWKTGQGNAKKYTTVLSTEASRQLQHVSIMLFVYHGCLLHVCSSSGQTEQAQRTGKFRSADCIAVRIRLTCTNDDLVCIQVGS